MEMYELEARYDARASFYGKATVIEKEDCIQLRSYSTIVAEIRGGKATVFGWYSATTGRHIKEFLIQNGFYAKNKEQILKDYGEG